MTRLAQDSVSVSTNDGKRVIVHFTNEQDGVADASESLRLLCKVICAGLEKKTAQTTETYIASLFSGALRASHGALVAVVASHAIPSFLNDCTALKPPVNLSAMVNAVLDNSRRNTTASGDRAPRSWNVLLRWNRRDGH